MFRAEEVELGLEARDRGRVMEHLHGRPSPPLPSWKGCLQTIQGEWQELRVRQTTLTVPPALKKRGRQLPSKAFAKLS